MLWNAQGIVSLAKRIELELFASQHEIDVILLCETFLSTNNEFSLRNFNIYRNDRATHGGGVAIAIKTTIQHKIIPIADTSSIENISMEININNTRSIITAAYSPRFNQQFTSDIKLLTSNDCPFFILGDLNAKHIAWNCDRNNQAGNSLFELQQREPFLIFGTAEHTHYPHSGATASTIDILLTNAHHNFELIALPNKLSSDHAPVICHILGKTVPEPPMKRYIYHKANWRNYKAFIGINIPHNLSLNSANDIDTAIEHFSSLILSAQRHCIPTANHQSKFNGCSNKLKRLIAQ